MISFLLFLFFLLLLFPLYNIGGDDNPSTNMSKLTIQEIDELLKKGAYDVFREENNNNNTEQSDFVEADLDTILARRSTKLIYDNNNSNNKSTLGSFSKASFISNHGNNSNKEEDVDINDPDFWKKIIGLSENNSGILHNSNNNNSAMMIGEDDTNNLLLLLPSQRIRRSVKTYDGVHLDGEEEENNSEDGENKGGR